MADNYLELRMEDYKAGRTSASRRPVSSKRTGTGEINVKFPSRRVFITGGASGIGRATVSRFCNAGCRVAFCDSDRTKGAKTAQDTGSQFYPCDVTDHEALEQVMSKLYDKWGDIDIIINNVGIAEFTPLAECEVDAFDRILATNLRPVFITSRSLMRHRMTLPQPNDFGGRIINICSTRAFQSEAHTQAYSASKGGILALTHSLMMDFAPLHVTVNCISPGWIVTSPDDIVTDSDKDMHPSGRVGRPDDIVRICMFLSAPDSDFINGENITADGGMTHKMIY
ncbi:MAG: SDR family oxidoreductase [Muribaculaceae bacterium]|nr:SDR family oxidoreductase [Muribaculaceae bacterium]